MTFQSALQGRHVSVGLFERTSCFPCASSAVLDSPSVAIRVENQAPGFGLHDKYAVHRVSQNKVCFSFGAMLLLFSRTQVPTGTVNDQPVISKFAGKQSMQWCLNPAADIFGPERRRKNGGHMETFAC